MNAHRRGGDREAQGEGLPVLSLVGRPNVGKSSLFNRLVGGRPALVEDMPGVTRDRRYGVCEWGTARFRVVDTGGLDPQAHGILAAMRSQTLRAVDEADVLVLVLDAAEGVTPVDQEVAALLRRTGKPILVAVNKVDSSLRDSAMAEGYALGFERVFGVSASHGRGVAQLLDAAVSELASAASPDALAIHGAPVETETGDLPIRLAFVGKPNAGKSSLVNRLLGEDRVLVHDQPGTTRDPIDTPFRAGDREFVLVDTAGLRRRRAIDTQTEAVAAKMARDQLARADVVALVIDAEPGRHGRGREAGQLHRGVGPRRHGGPQQDRPGPAGRDRPAHRRRTRGAGLRGLRPLPASVRRHRTWSGPDSRRRRAGIFRVVTQGCYLGPQQEL